MASPPAPSPAPASAPTGLARARRAAGGFAGSLLARVVVLMTLGSTLSALGALWLAEWSGQAQFEVSRDERVVASATDIATRLASAPAATLALLKANRIFGATLVQAPPPDAEAPGDAGLERALAQALGAEARARAHHVDSTLCPPPEQPHAAGAGAPPPSDCWLVGFTDHEGVRRFVAIGLPPRLVSRLDPLYFLLILASAGALSLVVARLATAPLGHLSRAAQTFSLNADPEPIPERGPAEVREALATFNLMQARVRAGVAERTQLLAAIAHDLQTPLTRLRLRLEQVGDEAIRERLVADLTALQRMVRNGLALARGADSREDWAVLALDSLLESLAEDAAEFGADVRLVAGCGARVRVKPEALTRCLANLVDNAVKYGGGAELACRRAGEWVEVTVRDHGPGVPASLLPRVFEPFVRGATGAGAEVAGPGPEAAPDAFPAATGSADGTGIGLTIARAQAMILGGTVDLANHPEGGALATLRLPALAPAPDRPTP